MCLQPDSAAAGVCNSILLAEYDRLSAAMLCVNHGMGRIE